DPTTSERGREGWRGRLRARQFSDMRSSARTVSGLALDACHHDALDEVALGGEEERDDREGGDQRRGHQQVLARLAGVAAGVGGRALEVVEADADGQVLLAVQVD